VGVVRESSGRQFRKLLAPRRGGGGWAQRQRRWIGPCGVSENCGSFEQRVVSTPKFWGSVELEATEDGF
jgi:hypothetical protein